MDVSTTKSDKPRRRGLLLPLLAILLVAGGIVYGLLQLTDAPATAAPVNGATPPTGVSASGALLGSVARLPRTTLGAYGSFEESCHPAWDLNRDPALVKLYGNGHAAVPVLRCNCGKIIRLLDHHIAADGSLTPSVWHDVPGCGWHVWARLEGWDQGEWQVGESNP